MRFSFPTPYLLFPSNTIRFNKYFWCSRFCESYCKPIKWVSMQDIAPNIHWSPKTFVSRRLTLVYCSLVLFQIYLHLFCVYFLACSKVSGKYFFRNPKTTDRPFTREYKRRSSVAKPSIFFTVSTIQPYQSTDGSHGKLA